MSSYLAEHNTGADLITAGCSAEHLPIYIAFSPSLPSSHRYRDILDKGLLRYKKNGRLQEIMSSHGIQQSTSQ